MQKNQYKFLTLFRIQKEIQMSEKYINPFTDFGFKKLFGEEVNKDLLLDFLNNLFVGKESIKDLTYKKNERLPNSPINRKAIFDLYCINEKGERFIVEIQRAEQKYFKDRSIFYSTFPIQEQAEPGTAWDFKLKAVYTVCIMDFEFDKNDDERFYQHIQLMNTNSKTVFYDKLTFIYLEMTKFNKNLSELETQFDKWMYVLKNLSKLKERPTELQERVFQKIFDVAELAKYTSEEREAYHESVKVYRDLKNVIDTSEEKGIAKGMIKGEKKKAEAIAMKMKTDGLDHDTISKYTGLSIDEISEL